MTFSRSTNSIKNKKAKLEYINSRYICSKSIIVFHIFYWSKIRFLYYLKISKMKVSESSKIFSYYEKDNFCLTLQVFSFVFLFGIAVMLLQLASPIAGACKKHGSHCRWDADCCHKYCESNMLGLKTGVCVDKPPSALG